MKEIKLNKGYIAFVDDEDYDFLSQFKWYIRNVKGKIYAYCSLGMHQAILKTSKQDILVDHIDSNGLNNQKKNLRKCTYQQNSYNSRGKNIIDKTSLYKGVYYIKNPKGNLKKRWCASIRHDGIRTFLGYFSTEIEAMMSYNNAAIKYHKEFAKLNEKTYEKD